MPCWTTGLAANCGHHQIDPGIKRKQKIIALIVSSTIFHPEADGRPHLGGQSYSRLFPYPSNPSSIPIVSLLANWLAHAIK